jgi:hypothetical protein
MVFNATYNNISDISSVLLLEETGVRLKIEQHEPQMPRKGKKLLFHKCCHPSVRSQTRTGRSCDYEKLNISVVFRDTDMP